MRSQHFESQVQIDASPAEVFAFLDDHRRLSSHMTRPSLMMAGARMTLSFDAHEGRALGSKITLKGRVLGMALAVEEVVTQYQPPHSKTWQTVETPRLLVVGAYTMGFTIKPKGNAALLQVFIDYTQPDRGFACLLGRVFGKTYASWCTKRMVNDAAAHFRRAAPVPH